MNRSSLYLLSVLALGCGAGDDEVPTATRCEEVRSHLVDLQLADVAAPEVDREAHRAAMTAALGEQFLTSCADSFRASQIDCVLGAADPRSATACVATR
jgi:hypothetical protein